MSTAIEQLRELVGNNEAIRAEFQRRVHEEIEEKTDEWLVDMYEEMEEELYKQWVAGEQRGADLVELHKQYEVEREELLKVIYEKVNLRQQELFMEILKREVFLEIPHP